jgi:hypothetical protein
VSATRIRFTPRALLEAADLRDDGAARARARAEHVRLVHDTWGVALGYAVGLVGRTAVVGPGVAYDCRGRPIVLSTTELLTVPRDAIRSGLVDLAVAWASDVSGHPGPLCPPAGRERPAFLWGAVDDVDAPPALSLRVGESVPLARLRLGTSPSVDLRVRRAAHPDTRARVASGWVALALDSVLDLLGWTQRVDTSAARFRATPVYHATVVVGDPGLVPLHGPMVSLRDASADGFEATVRYAVRDRIGDLPSDPPELTLEWIGVEGVQGCSPRADPEGAARTLGATGSALRPFATLALSPSPTDDSPSEES